MLVNLHILLVYGADKYNNLNANEFVWMAFIKFQEKINLSKTLVVPLDTVLYIFTCMIYF